MKLNSYYADLHIHVGHSVHTGPVKITASRRLTLPAILEECVVRKGIGVAGVVDCVTTGVRRELAELLEAGKLQAVQGGGYMYAGSLLLIPAAEVEAVEEDAGVSHWLGYFPDLESLAEFADYLAPTVTNMNLSSQRAYRTARELVTAIVAAGGEPVPAHAFTPYKSLYGNATDSLRELLHEQTLHVRVLELGLSADAELADRIPDNHRLSYVTSSDAHSAQKIGREHCELSMPRASYQEVFRAILGQAGRAVRVYYGLDPRLGKYHRTYCLSCKRTAAKVPPQSACPYCGSDEVVMGVLDRIEELARGHDARGRPERPPYRYQVPLEYIPGVGKRTIERLLDAFGTELEVLHKVPREELVRVVGPAIAGSIEAGRSGQLKIEPGGGGRYGRVIGQDQ